MDPKRERESEREKKKSKGDRRPDKGRRNRTDLGKHWIDPGR